MRVTDLKLANVRSIKAAELRFQPGFNLVVGDNGAGKTTVLEALAVCISEYAGRDLVAGAEAGSGRMTTAVADPRDSSPRAPA